MKERKMLTTMVNGLVWRKTFISLSYSQIACLSNVVSHMLLSKISDGFSNQKYTKGKTKLKKLNNC